MKDPQRIGHVHVESEQGRRHQGRHGNGHAGKDRHDPERQPPVDAAEPCQGGQRHQQQGNADEFDDHQGRGLTRVAGYAGKTQPEPDGKKKKYGGKKHGGRSHGAQRRGTGNAQHVEGKSQPESCQDEQQHRIRPEGAQTERTFAAPETACHRKGDPEVEHFFADPEQCHDGDGLFSKEHDGDQGPHRTQIGEGPAAIKTAGTRRIQMQGPGDTQGKEAAPDPGGDAQKGKGQ